MIGKKLVKVNNICMVNILFDENVVPELIQNDVTQANIYKTGKEILGDEKIYNLTKESLAGLKRKLGTAGASARAANYIHTFMNEA
jgi:lipid-A-disaccharide synthase